MVATVRALLPRSLKLGPFSLSHFLSAVAPLLFGFVATKENHVYVIIRATLTSLEWLDDFTIQPEPFQSGAADWGNTTKGFKSFYAS